MSLGGTKDLTQLIPPTPPFFVFAVIYGFFSLFGFRCWKVIWVGQKFYEYKPSSLWPFFVHLFDFGDKDDKILT